MPRLFLNDTTIRHCGFFLVLFATLALTLSVVSPGRFGSVRTAYAQADNNAGEDVIEEQADVLDAAAVDAASADQESYLVWYIKALGPLFAPVFGILSVLFVMLAVMNWISVNRNNIMPQPIIDRFRELLDEKNFQEAYEVAKDSDSPQGKILAAGLAKMSAGYEAAQQSMTDVAEEEVMRLEQKLGWIGMIAGIAPMLGLLGTVFGMVESFNVIARSGTAPQAGELAKGISTALITTQIGLLIAIPAIVIYEFFRNKLALLILEMSVQTENLMNRFKGA